MSINSINGVSSFNFGMMPSDPIKPETRQKLKELGIDESSVKTETQAQNKIQTKEEQIKKAIQERMQAEASQNIQVQSAQASQMTQGINNPEQVDGINKSEQIQQPQNIEAQQGAQNKQTGNEQMKAFAGSNAAQQPQQIQPFDLSNDIIALHNKLKLGLI